MAYLLRALIVLINAGFFITFLSAKGVITFEKFHHIHLAIPSYLLMIFVQAFVMFFFIGCSRLGENVHTILFSKENKLSELFDEIPHDLAPYKKEVTKLNSQLLVHKRQVIPHVMLIICLATLGFLLGGAHDTNLVGKNIHQGAIYGLLVALILGSIREWIHLGKNHRLLRELKGLFQIPDSSM